MIKKKQIVVNEKHWRGMSETELSDFTQLIFDYYRQEGFPYYPTNMESREKDFNKLMKYDRSNLLVDGVVKQTMHGLGLAWSYFPDSFNVRCGNKMTPYEAFMNDEVFLNVIKKRLRMGTYISDSGIRKMLKIYSNVQAVSNFRPTAAAAIYDYFGRNKKDFTVWDMSGGWGGRMLGAIVSGVDTYICTEPSKKAYIGLCELSNDFEGETFCVPINSGSENFKPNKNSLDLCFTSPPYFDLEKYSDEDSQSYKKFPEKNAWIEVFLRETFENCYYGLKSDGVMAINIADIKGNELEYDMVRVAIECGFILKSKFRLALSNINLKNKGAKFKFEPIYIFTK